jgi:hypothetical protein
VLLALVTVGLAAVIVFAQGDNGTQEGVTAQDVVQAVLPSAADEVAPSDAPSNGVNTPSGGAQTAVGSQGGSNAPSGGVPTNPPPIAAPPAPAPTVAPTVPKTYELIPSCIDLENPVPPRTGLTPSPQLQAQLDAITADYASRGVIRSGAYLRDMLTAIWNAGWGWDCDLDMWVRR